MKKDLRGGLYCVALASALWALPAAATEVRLGVGGDYAFEGHGIFSLLVQVNAPLVRHLSVGGRFGAFLSTNPSELGVPVDVSLRAHFDQLYLEGLAGPWIAFAPEPIRAHAAFGFGLQSSAVSAGIELGYYHTNAIIGLRLEFRL